MVHHFLRILCLTFYTFCFIVFSPSRPQYGGKACEGKDKVYKMCNVHECPKDSEDFHTVQCAIYNKQPFQGWYLQWKPQKRHNDGNNIQFYTYLLRCFCSGN